MKTGRYFWDSNFNEFPLLEKKAIRWKQHHSSTANFLINNASLHSNRLLQPFDERQLTPNMSSSRKYKRESTTADDVSSSERTRWDLASFLEDLRKDRLQGNPLRAADHDTGAGGSSASADRNSERCSNGRIRTSRKWIEFSTWNLQEPSILFSNKRALNWRQITSK